MRLRGGAGPCFHLFNVVDLQRTNEWQSLTHNVRPNVSHGSCVFLRHALLRAVFEPKVVLPLLSLLTFTAIAARTSGDTTALVAISTDSGTGTISRLHANGCNVCQRGADAGV